MMDLMVLNCLISVQQVNLSDRESISCKVSVSRRRQQLLLHCVSSVFQLGCMYRGEDSPSPTLVSPSFSSAWSGPESCLANPKYYSYIAVLALIATTMLVQVSHMVKLILMLLISVATGVINVYSWRDIFDGYDTARFQNYR